MTAKKKVTPAKKKVAKKLPVPAGKVIVDHLVNLAAEQVGAAKLEHTGKSVSYYKVAIEHPTSEGIEPYQAECNDIIEALDMTYAEANTFKSTWRIAAARLGKKKAHNYAEYDADKANFFSKRMQLAAEVGLPREK